MTTFRSFQFVRHHCFIMSSTVPEVIVLYTSFTLNPLSDATDSLSALSVQSHDEAEEETEGEQDSPEVASVPLLEIVKGALLGLVNKCIAEFLKDKCEGCEQSYPSQRHHTCIYGVPKDFIGRYYEELVKRLWTPHLLPTIMEILQKHGMKAKENRVKGMMETILYELRKMEYADSIDEIIEGLTELGNYKRRLAEQLISDFSFDKSSFDETDKENFLETDSGWRK